MVLQPPQIADLWGIFGKKWPSDRDHSKTTIMMVYSSRRPFERHSCLWFFC